MICSECFTGELQDESYGTLVCDHCGAIIDIDDIDEDEFEED